MAEVLRIKDTEMLDAIVIVGFKDLLTSVCTSYGKMHWLAKQLTARYSLKLLSIVVFDWLCLCVSFINS